MTPPPQTAMDAPAKPGRWLMMTILGLAMLQPISAGFWLSGFEHAAKMHAIGAGLLLLVALLQLIGATVSWMRRRADPRIVGRGLGILMILAVEAWAGRNSEFWLHVPVGVAIIMRLRR